MIPVRFLSKMGLYKVQVEGVTVDVRVVNRAEVVATGLAELKPLIGSTTAVGLMFKVEAKTPRMIQLCVGTRCLLIQLGDLLQYIPQCLKDFLRDPDICFVGVGMNEGVSGLRTYYQSYETGFKGGIELCELGAMVLKEPRYLSGCGIGTLWDHVGLGAVNVPKAVTFDCRAKVFSAEQLASAIHSVYCSHKIGSKLLAMI